MKVFVFSDSFSDKIGEPGIFAFDQMKALSEIGVDVIGISVDIRSIRRWRPWGVSKYRLQNVKIYKISVPIGRAPIGLQCTIQSLLFKKLLSLVIKIEGVPDLVHAHFGLIGASAVDGCRKYHIPLVITEHWSGLLSEEKLRSAYKYLAKGYDNASAVIAVSNNLASVIATRFGTRCIVIPNIVDVNAFSYQKRGRDWSEFRFISVGNLLHGKGFDILIESLSRLKRVYSDFSLTIVGDGPERDSLTQQIQNCDLTSEVKLVGRLPRLEIGKIMEESDCFILTSRFETFGVVYIEALASGLPVIATNCGGPADIVNESNGILVPVDNVDQISDAMKKMIDTRILYNNETISNDAKRMYSPSVIAEKINKVFKSVVC